MKRFTVLFVLLAFMFSVSSGFAAAAKPAATTPGIVAAFNEVYDGNSTLVNTPSSQNYKQIDFMYVAFVHVNAVGSTNYDANLKLGTLTWENTPYKPSTFSGTGKEWEASAYKNMYTLAHAQNPNMKFIVSLGWGSKFNDIPTIEDNLNTFTQSLVAFIKQQKSDGAPVDGFDIDYETPQFKSTESFNTVAKAIRTALDAQGKLDGKHYYFTISPNNTYNLDGATLNSTCFDWINVQSYQTAPDASCPVTKFINAPMNVSPSKILAGADTQNSPTDYVQADSNYQKYNLAGVFAWMFGCIGNYNGGNWQGTWSPNYTPVLTPMYNTTHPASSKEHKPK